MFAKEEHNSMFAKKYYCQIDNVNGSEFGTTKERARAQKNERILLTVSLQLQCSCSTSPSATIAHRLPLLLREGTKPKTRCAAASPRPPSTAEVASVLGGAR